MAHGGNRIPPRSLALDNYAREVVKSLTFCYCNLDFIKTSYLAQIIQFLYTLLKLDTDLKRSTHTHTQHTTLVTCGLTSFTFTCEGLTHL